MVTEDSQVALDLRAQLAECLGRQRFELWFGDHTQFRLTESRLVVVATCSFTRDWLRRNFAAEILACASAFAGREIEIEFEADESLEATSAVEAECTDKITMAATVVGAPPAKPTICAQPAKRTVAKQVDAKEAKPAAAEPTFAKFAVGKCNEYAFTAATMTARGSQQASPVLLSGPTSVGKTHLLRSLRGEYRRHHPRARAVYLTAEQFTTSFVEALHGTGLPSFRQKCRGADLLLIDDVQFFAGKRASLGELLHTLDAMQTAGRQMVLASDRTLAELRNLGKELVSRLAGGLVCEMELPDFATRLEIVRRLGEEMKLAFDDEVATLVATQISAGARELRGALHRLQAVGNARRTPVTLQLATAELAELAQQSARNVRLADVEHAVCGVFGVEPAQLRSERKGRSINEPRMLAMWLARKYTRAPWSEIGEFFGRRSHSTVIAAHRRVEQLIRTQSAIGVSHDTCGVEEAIRRVEAALRTA